jgi:hypothetical protein
MSTEWNFGGYCGQGKKITTPFHQFPRIKMHAAVVSLFRIPFME